MRDASPDDDLSVNVGLRSDLGRVTRPHSTSSGRPAAVELAATLDYPVEVVEAYVWPEHARVFTSWYETLRDARTALDVDDVDAQVARQLVKDIYVRTIGMMGSRELHAGKRGYAPDRRHAIVAKARSNLLRRVHQIGTDSRTSPMTRTRSAPGRASPSTSAGAWASTRPSAAACSPRTCRT